MDKLMKNHVLVFGIALLIGVLTLKFFVDRSASNYAAAVSAAEAEAAAVTAEPAKPILKSPAVARKAANSSLEIERVHINKNRGVEMARLGGYSALPAAKKTVKKIIR